MKPTTRSADLIIREDMHVHSTFSDGADSIEANIEAAVERGLDRICCVDHVRAATYWVPDFVAAVRKAAKQYEGKIEVLCGVEAKFIDSWGTLDVPDEWHLADFVFAADHQLPIGGGYMHPRAALGAIEQGQMTAEEVIRDLARAMIGSMERYDNVVIAHPFSILPKIGRTEEDVPVWTLREIAAAAVRTGSRIEISERWKCPDRTAVAVFGLYGVDLLASTDAHTKEAVGAYEYAERTIRLGLAEAKAGPQRPPQKRLELRTELPKFHTS